MIIVVVNLVLYTGRWLLHPRNTMPRIDIDSGMADGSAGATVRAGIGSELLHESHASDVAYSKKAKK